MCNSCFHMSGKPTAQLLSWYGIKDIYSTNHSTPYHCSTNQNALIRHGHGTVLLLHGTNRTVTTSHSFENDSSSKLYMYMVIICHDFVKDALQICSDCIFETLKHLACIYLAHDSDVCICSRKHHCNKPFYQYSSHLELWDAQGAS